VGNTLVAGPTGMGKSVLLATLAMQFRRYRGSRIFAFDMGRSMRAAILGLGGEHYDLGADGEIAFQPLARIDREGYRTWAAEWVEGRLLHEGVAVGGREGGHLVGAGQPGRCAGGAAHDDGPVGPAAIERCARRSRPMCWAARTASCWMPTTTGSAWPTCRLRDGGADAQQGRRAGGAALPVRASMNASTVRPRC
jgi:hypothetical protein